MGCRVIMLYPDVAARSCLDCRTYLYDDRPDKFGDKPLQRAGKPIKRQPGQRTPCAWCPKQPPWVAERDRTPQTACELSEANWQTYQHYLECKAVGQFPDDAIVRRNAGVIRQAEELAATVRSMTAATILRG